jgi:hypothetical protein
LSEEHKLAESLLGSNHSKPKVGICNNWNYIKRKGIFMECKFEMDVREPNATGKLFYPSIKFRIKQLNMTPECKTDHEIDYQINELIRKVEELRKKVKNKLKAEKSKHNIIITKVKT